MKKELADKRAKVIKDAQKVLDDLALADKVDSKLIVEAMKVILDLMTVLKETTEQARIDELRFVEKIKAKAKVKRLEDDLDDDEDWFEEDKKIEIFVSAPKTKSYDFKDMLEKI